MPSMIPPGALLSMADVSGYPDGSDQAEDDDNNQNFPPWCWVRWQERTGLTRAPFSPSVHDETPDAWKLSGGNDCVWAFLSHFLALSDTQRTEYIKRRQDNNEQGRNLWLTWFHAHWTKWRINQTVVDAWAEHKVDPYSVMGRLKMSKVNHCVLSSFLLC